MLHKPYYHSLLHISLRGIRHYCQGQCISIDLPCPQQGPLCYTLKLGSLGAKLSVSMMTTQALPPSPPMSPSSLDEDKTITSIMSTLRQEASAIHLLASRISLSKELQANFVAAVAGISTAKKVIVTGVGMSAKNHIIRVIG